MESIKHYLCTLFQLSEEEADIFLSRFTRVELEKKAVFVEEGKICNKIGLIDKGLMMCVYNKNGEEIIYEFAFEQRFISDYYSFVTHTPSAKEIRCLEDTTLYVISRQHLEELGKAYPFVESMSRMVNERLFLQAHDRLKSLLLDTAQERYQQLLSGRPDLAERIPQYLIASYLHVKPETISRIRKKLATK
jgi:CRP-like cAMP-binding protein